MTTMFLFIEIPAVLVILLILLILMALAGPLLFGSVLISERQVGIVVKRWGGRGLEPGRLIALNGEAGYQAETLAPGTARESLRPDHLFVVF